MASLRTFVLGSAALSVAFAIGYVMQYGPQPETVTQSRAAPLLVTDISLTSAGTVVHPVAPRDLGLETLPEDLSLTAVTPGEALIFPVAGHTGAEGTDCAISLEALTGAGALVDLTLSAPCQISAPVTISHEGLVFRDRTDSTGSLSVQVPALVEEARFAVEFEDGTGSATETNVTSVAFYDRVVVQWQGAAGLQLHALEYGSGYFQPGHVWTDAAGDLGAAARGEGGFLLRLGQEDVPSARLAEVYSFPALTARKGGIVALSVEAEVTQGNCGREIAAQTLQHRAESRLRTQEVVLRMPDCAFVGDVMVLNNVLDNLTIAGNK